MTKGEAGMMTKKDAGMTKRDAAMTKRDARMTKTHEKTAGRRFLILLCWQRTRFKRRRSLAGPAG